VVENVYRIFSASFRGAAHLCRILEEAQAIAGDAIPAPQKQRGIPFGAKPKEKP
jgi:hypothetical protein